MEDRDRTSPANGRIPRSSNSIIILFWGPQARRECRRILFGLHPARYVAVRAPACPNPIVSSDASFPPTLLQGSPSFPAARWWTFSNFNRRTRSSSSSLSRLAPSRAQLNWRSVMVSVISSSLSANVTIFACLNCRMPRPMLLTPEATLCVVSTLDCCVLRGRDGETYFARCGDKLFVLCGDACGIVMISTTL